MLLGRQSRVIELLSRRQLGEQIRFVHYVGMAGLRFPGSLFIDTDLVVAFVGLSVSLGAFSTKIFLAPEMYKTHSLMDCCCLR